MIKKVFQFFKWFFIVFITIVLLLVVVGYVFIQTSPEFGGEASETDIARYKKSKNYKEGIFINEQETIMDMSFDNMVDSFKEMMEAGENIEPHPELVALQTDPNSLKKTDRKETKMLWFGHSAVLLQIDGKNILLDPMLGDVPAPHSLLGGERYAKELPLEISELPEIDAVIISHDHYDHLDYGSMVELKEKSKRFYAPLGVGNHLREWGIEESLIHELDWWDEMSLGSITLAFTPSRHFSGRGLSDRAKTLWGSWVVKGKNETLYFSGDGGYGPHFKKIGAKYGPFELAFMECGQYNEKWANIHMFPEQSAQAGKDLGANVVMPIHWGAFTLAMHDWTDPVVRIHKKAEELGVKVITPQIGEIVIVGDSTYSSQKWWENR